MKKATNLIWILAFILFACSPQDKSKDAEQSEEGETAEMNESANDESELGAQSLPKLETAAESFGKLDAVSDHDQNAVFTMELTE